MLPSVCFSTSHSVILLLLEVELCFSTSHSLFWLLLEVELCSSTSHSLFWLLLQVELCSSTSHSRLGLFSLNFPFLLSSTFFFSYTPSCKHSAWFFALASSAFFFAHVSIAVPFCTYFINLLFSVLKFVFSPTFKTRNIFIWHLLLFPIFTHVSITFPIWTVMWFFRENILFCDVGWAKFSWDSTIWILKFCDSATACTMRASHHEPCRDIFVKYSFHEFWVLLSIKRYGFSLR